MVDSFFVKELLYTFTMTYPDGVKMTDARYCPSCSKDFKGQPIPEHYRKSGNYGDDPDTHYSLLIGIEIPGKYDGISQWRCPFCDYIWNRF